MGQARTAGTSCGTGGRAGHIWYFLGPVLAFGLSVIAAMALAQDFRFTNVQIEGNQRISDGAILTQAGIAPGEPLTGGELNDAYQRILGSGFFETVELEPQGSTLRIRVVERPTINRINFEGNRRLDDEALAEIVESTPRQVFNPAQAERDAVRISEAYSQQGRVASRVSPRIIRRSDNRVDLIFEIAEGESIEVERISFVGNQAFSDRRLRRVLETTQANILRAFIGTDTLIEDRIEFDRQVLRDFYLSRGYVDFRTLSVNAELTRERDGVFLVFNVEEGQQFRFGQITTRSEYPGVSAQDFQEALRIRPGVIYSPSLVENSIARQERLAIRKGLDFLRVEPVVTRNDRDLTLDVEFVLTRGQRIFVERIDIEGNTTTLDRVVRRQFRVVEGDPFNPREIRESAERIRALGFFAQADVEARQGSAPDQVVIDVDVEEQPTGSLSVGGSYSRSDGFGVALGLQENNFLGRGQRLALTWSSAEDAEQYTLGFTEPALLGRDLIFDLDLGYAETDSSFATYDTERLYVRPALSFPLGERSRLQVRALIEESEMILRDEDDDDDVLGDDEGDPGPVILREIAEGDRLTTALGYTYSYDSRIASLNPNAGWLLSFGQDFAGLGGDNEYIKTTARAVAQTRVFNEEVTLRATFEAGALTWLGDNNSRAVDRYILNPDIMRGFEPGGIGPRDQTGQADDPLGGNFYAVARFDAEFPLGLPEELNIRGGLFYDVGNLWNLDDVDTSGATIVGESGDFRHVVGISILWQTPIGPLRFNFSEALISEDFDEEQSFDLTLSTRF